MSAHRDRHRVRGLAYAYDIRARGSRWLFRRCQTGKIGAGDGATAGGCQSDGNSRTDCEKRKRHRQVDFTLGLDILTEKLFNKQIHKKSYTPFGLLDMLYR